MSAMEAKMEEKITEENKARPKFLAGTSSPPLALQNPLASETAPCVPLLYPSPQGLERINTDTKFDPTKTTFYLWRFLFRQAAQIGNIYPVLRGTSASSGS